MKKNGKADGAPSKPQYSVEILTASPEGLQVFIDKLKAIRQAHPAGICTSAQIKTTGTGDYREMPIVSMFPKSEIGRCIGPLNRTINPSRVTEYEVTMRTRRWWFSPDPVVVTGEGNIINGQHRLLAAEEWLNFVADGLDRAKERVKSAAAGLERAKTKDVKPANPQLAALAGIDPFEYVPKSREERIRAAEEALQEARDRLVEAGVDTYPQFVVVWGVDKRAAILMDESRRSATDRRDIAMRYAASR